MNTTQRPLFLVTAILFIFLYACSTSPSSKTDYISEYDSFVKDVKANKESYTAEQWAEKDQEFARFSQELSKEFEGDLSFIEQGRLAKFAMQYGIARSKGALDDIKDVVNTNEFKDAIKEFKNVWNNELKGEYGSAVQELEGVWNDELKGELSGSLDELKALLDDDDLREELKGKIDEVKNIINDKELEGKIKSATTELQGVLEHIEQEVDKVAK